MLGVYSGLSTSIHRKPRLATVHLRRVRVQDLEYELASFLEASGIRILAYWGL